MVWHCRRNDGEDSRRESCYFVETVKSCKALRHVHAHGYGPVSYRLFRTNLGGPGAATVGCLLCIDELQFIYSGESWDEVVQSGVGSQTKKDNDPEALHVRLFNGLAIYGCDWIDEFIACL